MHGAVQSLIVPRPRKIPYIALTHLVHHTGAAGLAGSECCTSKHLSASVLRSRAEGVGSSRTGLGRPKAPNFTARVDSCVSFAVLSRPSASLVGVEGLLGP